MNNLRIIFAIVSCCIFEQVGFPQQYFTKSYTIENGLPTRIVNDACQDSNGVMWFATFNGISSYDGFRFTNFDANNGLPRHSYRKVKFDQAGVLWGIPYSICDTLVCFHHGSWKKINPPSKNPKIEVSAFDLCTRNRQTVICIGHFSGLDILQDGRWIHVDVSKDPLKNQIFSVISKDGNFLVLTKTGIWILDQDKNGWGIKEYYLSAGDPILAMYVEGQGRTDEKLWMLTSHRLMYLIHGKLNIFADNFSLPETNTLGKAFLNFDNHGNVYFGNNFGKYFIRSTGSKAFPLLVKNGFSSNGAAGLFIDREDNLWFLDSRGVDKINNLMGLNYFQNHGLLENEVTAILELANGGFVFGHNKGITVFDGQKFTRFPFSVSDDIQARVMDIIQDKQGNVWIAASRLGFGKMMKDGKFKWYPMDSNSLAVSIHQDLHGRIWMSSSQELFYLKNDRLIPYEHNDRISSPFRKIFSAGKDEIIGVGLYGAYVVSENKVRKIPFDGEDRMIGFFTYFKSRSGIEYFGTSEGLYFMNNGAIRKFRQNGISIDSPVYFIFQDTDQNYWIGSNNGVIKWDGKTRIETLSIKNGLAGRETNRSAGMVDSHGGVWIGTDMGLSSFMKGFSGFNTKIPVIKLLNIEDTKGNHHSFIDNIFIGFNDNTLVFHFRGISFVNEELISYRYKLEGFDHDWQVANQPNLDKIKFSGLKPGKYRFIVQARNASGDWSEIACSGFITIKTPVFRTWWFILIVLIVISAIIFGIYKLILQRQYNLRLEKEISERKLAEQLLRESQELYKLITDKMADVVWLMDLYGKSTFVSPSIEQFTGFSVNEYLQQTIENRFAPDSVEVVKRQFGNELPRLIAQPESLHGYINTQRLEYNCKNGGTKWGELLMTPLFGPNGALLGIHGVTRDITEGKQAEESLKQKARELESFNSLMIGRELKMIELKKEINELLLKLNKPEKYTVHEL
ncbi:MAG: PAS domain S-box protein [Bacteroidota bacterium]